MKDLLLAFHGWQSLSSFSADDALWKGGVCLHRMKAMKAGLAVKKSLWYVLKLGSIATIMREWIALHSADKLLFKETLLTARPAASHKAALQVPQVADVWPQQPNQSLPTALQATRLAIPSEMLWALMSLLTL